MIESLAIELLKVKGNLANNILYDIFQTEKKVQIWYNFTGILCFKAWNMIPLEIKNSESVEIFKTKVRNEEPKSCYIYLCQTYINNLVFVNVI